MNGSSLRRRDVLGAGAAMAATALAGCATPMDSGPSIGRVVVIGAGYGGATAAHYLRRWGGSIDVTLVDRQPQFISCPISNLVIGGHRKIGDITQGYDGLSAMGVKVLRGEVTAIDAQKREVRLASGQVLPYDRLVVSPGVDFMTAGVGGLDAALAAGRVTHAWKAGEQTVALRRQLEAMADGGVFAMSIPLSPFRCPPGPYERTSMVASYFKQAKPRSKIIIFDANPDIQSKKGLFLAAWKQHYDGMIDYRPNATLREVGADNRAKFDFEDVRADVLNVIPPMRAGDIARQAGLITANDRWCGVDWLTLESTAVPRVHVLGDATLSAPGMPKSGHMANQQAKVAAAAIVALLKGEPVNQAPVVVNTCYSFVTGTEAMHVASVHQYVAAEKTFKPVAGSGGVSKVASESEGRYAMGWARNIWADTLGQTG